MREFMNTTENPIAIRSKDMLSDALLTLMTQKSYSEISIGEITKEADLARRTFYRLFDSKDELLLYHMKSLWEKEAPLLYSHPDRSYQYTSFFHLSFWYKNKELAFLLYKNNLIGILFSFIDMISPDIYKNRKPESSLIHHPDAFNYALAYSTGGALSVIWKWIGLGMKESPAELMQLFGYAFDINPSPYA